MNLEALQLLTPIHLAAYLASFLFVAAGLVILRPGFKKLPFKQTYTEPTPLQTDKKWRLALVAFMLLAGGGLLLLLSLAWVQGDDWRNIVCATSSYTARPGIVLSYYLDWVSRFGDTVIQLFGQSLSHWETNIITVLTALAAPFAFLRLCGKRGDTVLSAKGFALYVFIFCLCLIGVCLTPWRNYRCWAAVVNYLIPTVLTLFFLSYYRPDTVDGGKGDSKRLCIGLFLLGTVCGWGTECMDILLVPGLALWFLYARLRKIPWGVSRLYGLLGMVLGATLLFASPALASRSSCAREDMQLQVSNLTPEQIQDFLSHLSADSLELLKGAGGVVFIGDFSFIGKLHFLPFLMERCWACFGIGLCVTLLLLILTLIFNGKDKYRTAAVAVVGLGAAFIMSCSYLNSCIPTPMSFLPPAFVVIASAVYLLVRVRIPLYVNALFSAGLLAGTLWIFVPSGIEAWHYKKYEKALFAEMDRQAREGKDIIELPAPYPVPPVNKLGLISKENHTGNERVVELLTRRHGGKIIDIHQENFPTTPSPR